MDLLNYTDDLELRKWLTDGIDFHKLALPRRLKDFLPSVFDHYITVFGTPGIIDNFPFSEIVFPPQTLEQTNRNVAIWRKFGLFYGIDEKLYRPTTYKYLSERFSLDYKREAICKLPWFTKGINSLPSDTRTVLEKIVNKLGKGSILNLYVEDYERWTFVFPLLPVEQEVIYKVTTESYIYFMEETYTDANAYLFPDDKSWCLLNLEDLNFLILAFNQKHIDSIDGLHLDGRFSLTLEDILFGQPN